MLGRSLFSVGVSVSSVLVSLVCGSLAFAADVDDQRYVVALYSMPTMTYSDVKTCARLMKLSEGEMKKAPGVLGLNLGVHAKPYWKFVRKIGSNGGASKRDVLVSGAFVDAGVEPSYVLSGGLIKESEQCGFVTGQLSLIHI